MTTTAQLIEKMTEQEILIAKVLKSAGYLLGTTKIEGAAVSLWYKDHKWMTLVEAFSDYVSTLPDLDITLKMVALTTYYGYFCSSSVPNMYISANQTYSTPSKTLCEVLCEIREKLDFDSDQILDFLT